MGCCLSCSGRSEPRQSLQSGQRIPSLAFLAGPGNERPPTGSCATRCIWATCSRTFGTTSMNTISKQCCWCLRAGHPCSAASAPKNGNSLRMPGGRAMSRWCATAPPRPLVGGWATVEERCPISSLFIGHDNLAKERAWSVEKLKTRGLPAAWQLAGRTRIAAWSAALWRA